jgi:hypothetical protein
MLDVPFRSALDGSEYADTNSGVASVGMALEAFGFSAATADLRALANTLSRNYDVGQPPRIDMLVRLGEQAGLRGSGLLEGMRLKTWTLDEIREQVRNGRPVLTMIQPDDASGDGEQGRERFVLIVGMRDGALIYHDPSFPDGRGAKRVLPNTALLKAWAAGPAPSQAAGLGLGQSELGLFAPLDQLVLAQQPPAPLPVAREVPTASARERLSPLAQLVPVNVDEPQPDPATQPWWSVPIHPLLLAFWLVAAVVLFKVVSKLVFN